MNSISEREQIIREAIYERSIDRDSFMLIDGREVYYRDVLAAFGLEKIEGWKPHPPAGEVPKR